jgi:hypothetical protein
MPGEAGDGGMNVQVIALMLTVLRDPLAEIELRRQLGREAYECGRADGWREGYERGARILETEWRSIVAPILADRPDHAELDRRRWGPGGREHFGDRRPGDRFPRSKLEAAS